MLILPCSVHEMPIPSGQEAVLDASEHYMQQCLMHSLGYKALSSSPSCHSRKWSNSESIAIRLASLDDNWQEWQCSIPNAEHQSLLHESVWCIWYRVMPTRSALPFLGASFSYILSRWHHRWQPRWQLWAKLQLCYCKIGAYFKCNIDNSLLV